jgi:transposase
VEFGVRLPRGLSSGFAEKAMATGCGIPGLDGAMRGLLAARNAILKAIVAINADAHSGGRSTPALGR